MASAIVVPKYSVLTEPDVVAAFTQAKSEITTVLGRQAVTQAASTASDVAGLKTDFNTLLASLKTAGLVL